CYIGDGQAGERVVVVDRPQSLTVGDDAVVRARQVHEECLVGFVEQIADDAHEDVLAGHARGKGHDAVGGDKVAAGNGRAAGGGEVDCHWHRVRVGKSDSENGIGEAGVG